MNTIDLGLLGLFFAALFYGYRKGFVGQAIGLVGLVLSLLISYSFSQDTAVFLQKQFPLPKESNNLLFQTILDFTSIHHLVYTALAFMLLFFITRLLCNMLGKLLQSFAELPIISLFNRWLGAFLGLTQVFVIVFIAAQLATYLPESNWKESIQNSQITRYLLEFSPRLSQQILEVPKSPQNQKDIL